MLGLTAAALACLAPTVHAAVPAGFTDALVASPSSPTDVIFTPDGRMLVTSQGGTLSVFNPQNGTLLATAITFPGTQICSNSERGLLGVAVDPAFASNGFVYLYYTHRKPGGDCSTPAGSPITSLTAANRVSRFTMSGNTLAAGSEVVLIDEMPSPGGNHNAGDLGFGKDGYLYITIGDGGCDYAGGGCGGSNDASRDQFKLTGKILRIAVNPDGSTSIPPSNPFQGAGTARCALTGGTTPGNKCQETFAWGLRNPFRFAFDPNAAATRLFINDVGQNTREEIDLGQAGADYGWNCREGTIVNSTSGLCNPAPPNMVDPIYDYGRGTVPGTTGSGCASITGGAFVPNGLWPAAYDGTYLFADYVCGWIFRLPGSTPFSPAADFATNLGGSTATSLAFGPFGPAQALYYTTYAAGGQVRRISYAQAGNNAPTAVASGNPLNGPTPLTVTFDATGSSDPDGDPLTYFWSFGDGSADVVTTNLTVQHTYNAGGTFTATLRARDSKFAFSNPVTLVVQPGDTPPVPVIDLPTAGATFAVGQTITLHGHATDAEEGTIPDARLSWTVIRHHSTHTHPFLGPVTGNDVTFTGPVPEDLLAATNSYLEIQLTATDLSGATATVTRNIQPRKVDLTFATNPAGLVVNVNDNPLTGPQTVTSWEGWVLDVEAPTSQVSGGQTYLFSSWTDGADSVRALTTPAAPATYTAVYQLSTDSGPENFFTLPPCRLVDTRNPAGPLGGPALSAGQTRTFHLAGTCLIPASARALAVNVTVTGPGINGHLRLFSADELRPSTSVISFAAGQTRAAQTIVKLSAGGDVSVFCGMASGSVHFVLDVTGYFE
jgi:glucose/arabinose dehydrogenase